MEDVDRYDIAFAHNSWFENNQMVAFAYVEAT